MPTSVFIVDDHEMVARGIERLIREHDDLEVAGLAHNGDDAIAGVEAYRPDVALIDLDLPLIDGIELARLVRQKSPRTRVIILSAYCDADLVVRAVALGVQAYLTKDETHEQLIAAIRAVGRGNRHYGQTIGRIAAELFGTTEDPDRVPDTVLTDDERRVFRLRALGYSIDQIGNRLLMQPKTAQEHWNRAVEKVGMRSISIGSFAARPPPSL